MTQNSFKKIGLIGKHQSQELLEPLQKLSTFLQSKGCVVDYEILDTKAHKNGLSQAFAEKNFDLVITLGGDGTFLAVARHYCKSNTPLLGVNLGLLGFLTDFNLNTLEQALTDVLQGKYLEETRHLLKAHINQEEYSFHAFNDVVIHQSNMARMLELDVWIDGNYLTNYRADGLIISTPTGSTAYALSAGGPLVFPTIAATLITPICPHTLSHRPILIPAHHAIKIQLSQNWQTDAKITFDGQEYKEFLPQSELNIGLSKYSVRIIHPTHYNYFTLLRSKLNWGVAPVNNR